MEMDHSSELVHYFHKPQSYLSTPILLNSPYGLTMHIHPYDSAIIITTPKEIDEVIIGFHQSTFHTFGPKSIEVINRKMAELKTELDALRVPSPL